MGGLGFFTAVAMFVVAVGGRRRAEEGTMSNDLERGVLFLRGGIVLTGLFFGRFYTFFEVGRLH